LDGTGGREQRLTIRCVLQENDHPAANDTRCDQRSEWAVTLLAPAEKVWAQFFGA